MNVYLDDMRRCPEGFVLAKNVEECITLLESCEVHTLSLDYHLGWGEQTGMAVIEYMIHHQIYPQIIYLHSSDLTARSRMYEQLYLNKPADMQLYAHPMQ